MPEISRAVAGELSAIIALTLQSFSDNRKTYVEQIQAQSIRDGNVLGQLEMTAPGELLASLTFPVTFLEKPVFTYGLELADNYWPTVNAFPLCTPSVVTWHTKYLPSDVLAYVGVDLGIVVLGPDDLHTFLHYSFAGQSFTNPTSEDSSMDAVL